MEWNVLQDAGQTLLNQPLSRWMGASLAVLAWLAVCAQSARQARLRRHSAPSASSIRFAALSAGTDVAGTEGLGSSGPAGESGPRVLLAWASQLGTAQQLAWQTARALQSAGHAVEVQPLDALSPEQCAGRPAVFFIVSTTGEGDPPDHAAGFADDFMRRLAPALKGQAFAVLALGDREYKDFCAFGLRLSDWLIESGARALWPTVEVDNEDADALSAWHTEVAQWIDATSVPGSPSAPAIDITGAAAPAAEGASTPYLNWRLTGRRHLNPGSTGEPMMLVDLTAPPDVQSPLLWEPGDLLQVVRPDEDARPRDYSIACICDPSPPAQVQLLVRRHRRSDGSFGHVSSWLTHDCPLEGHVMARLRPHANFRLPPTLADRPLILIGNGTGLAGLRAHLQAAEQALWNPDSARARLLAEARHAWLVLGERQLAHDELLDAEVAHAVASGVISRLDRVFSRDGGPQRYVQDALRDEAARLRDWLNAGAVVLLCGSLSMATGVETVIDEVMGGGTTLSLRRQGLLRRDVY